MSARCKNGPALAVSIKQGALKIVFGFLFSLVFLTGLSAKTYVFTGEGFHFVCKEAASIEGFIVAFSSLDESDMTEVEQMMVLLDLMTQHACIFMTPGSQLIIPDEADKQELDILGQSFPIASAEIIGEDRKMCIIDDDGNCSIVDFSGEVWYPTVLLDQGGAVELR